MWRMLETHWFFMNFVSSPGFWISFIVLLQVLGYWGWVEVLGHFVLGRNKKYSRTLIHISDITIICLLSARTRHLYRYILTVSSKIKARAMLTPTNARSGSQAQAMYYRTLNIGTDPSSDLCLTEYGTCSNVSSQHASIFYDEVCATTKICSRRILYALTYS